MAVHVLLDVDMAHMGSSGSALNGALPRSTYVEILHASSLTERNTLGDELWHMDWQACG